MNRQSKNNQKIELTQRTINFLSPQFQDIGVLIEQFLTDKKINNLASGTMKFYTRKLQVFLTYCQSQQITNINQFDSRVFRLFLLWLEERGHNLGGRQGFYRSIRAFLFWYENEYEPDDWKNPVKKVKCPKGSIEPLEPVSLENIQELLKTCSSNRFSDIRDQALLLVLLDTGVRASELLDIDLNDYDDRTGSILIRQGKGRKPRTVFIQRTTRKKLRKYLRIHPGTGALWLTIFGDRLAYGGLRELLNRRAKRAGIKPPTAHDFRRAFAINSLRNGIDVFSLQKLMGHSSLAILRRYLDQNNDDLAIVHSKTSPVEGMRLK